MILFRIEHPADEDGPYRRHRPLRKFDKNQMVAYKEWIKRSDNHSFKKRTPHPYSENIKKWEEDYSRYIFAFQTEDHLKKWFSREERRLLKKAGFILVVIEISEIFEGKNSPSGQVVINKNKILCKAEKKIPTR